MPRIVQVEDDRLVLYKPALMHTAPLREGETGTLLARVAERYPEVLAVRGRKAVEGGVLHRLDFETRGLVLIARTQEFYDMMLRLQESGLFIKDYRARVAPAPPPPGFPPPPVFNPEAPLVVTESAFRPYGPGRKAVRPTLGGKIIYKSEIRFGTAGPGGEREARIRISRGARHQIRCHLAWLGLPIIGDALYGGIPSDAPLDLEATELRF